MLTPSSASSPRPSDSRASMTAASAGRLATSRRPSSRSHQRKAGMPWLSPCSRPAWLTGVVDGTRARHSVHVWLPDRTQRLIVGRLPARISFSSKGAGTPSSCTNTTPGRPSTASGRRPVQVVAAAQPPAPPTHAHRVDGEVVLAVDREEPREGGHGEAVDPGREEHRQEAVDLDPGSEVEAEPDDGSVGEEREHHRSGPSEEAGDPHEDRAQQPAGDGDADDRQHEGDRARHLDARREDDRQRDDGEPGEVVEDERARAPRRLGEGARERSTDRGRVTVREEGTGRAVPQQVEDHRREREADGCLRGLPVELCEQRPAVGLAGRDDEGDEQARAVVPAGHEGGQHHLGDGHRGDDPPEHGEDASSRPDRLRRQRRRAVRARGRAPR